MAALFIGLFNTVFGDLKQYKTVVPLFGVAYAAPNKGTTILYWERSGSVNGYIGRVVDSRLRGRGLEPHRRHCVVVIEQDTFILA